MNELSSYLVCGKCGVVFAVVEQPVCCPICRAEPENFRKYSPGASGAPGESHRVEK
ncbi:MAG: hypothetical protein IH914_11400 [candidate division Zixibacteria bacterium]|nr:hypothetical protein [candidate division Zixibacteria bacterium]